MIECYFNCCPHHEEHEPFCTLDKCVQTEETIFMYQDIRQKQLEDWAKKDAQETAEEFYR